MSIVYQFPEESISHSGQAVNDFSCQRVTNTTFGKPKVIERGGHPLDPRADRRELRSDKSKKITPAASHGEDGAG